MPEERVLTDRSHKPYPPQKRPPGLFPRLACLRVFEGLRVRCEVAELAERLRAMGAVVVTEDQQRAHVARFEGLRSVGARLGNCHEDTCMHAHAVANDSSEDLDLVVQGHEATPLRDDDDRLVGPVGVGWRHAALLRARPLGVGGAHGRVRRRPVGGRGARAGQRGPGRLGRGPRPGLGDGGLAGRAPELAGLDAARAYARAERR